MLKKEKKTETTAERRKRSVKRGRSSKSTSKSKGSSVSKKTSTKVSVKTSSKVQAIARKVKAVSKTIKRKVRKTVKAIGPKDSSVLIGAPAVQVLSSVDDVLLTPQERIEDAKYFVASQMDVDSEQISFPFEETELELPTNYGDNKVVLLVRDPWWIFSYWELQPDVVESKKQEIPQELRNDVKFIMRVYDISYIDFNGQNAHYYFDITIPYGADKWYINVGAPGRSWIAEMGWLTRDNRFYPVVRSNVVHTPLDGPSWITDEEWAIPEELFAKLYSLSVGVGGIGSGLSSAEIHKLWSQMWQMQLSSGAVSSFGASEFVAHRQENLPSKGKRKFWLVVNTELIVYGATEPDAKVTVAGKPVQLREDGTFTLRFALPDGRQEIPVEGVSCDGVDKIVITPIVQKETR